jgi:uncharacterized protein
MKIELNKSLALPLSPAPAWDLLQDIESVATCMPGASINQRVDDAHYKGAVTVRVGPATVAFKGTLEIVDRNEREHRLHITGRGADASGGSAASLDLVARIAPGDANHSRLEGRSEITVNGKVAALGSRLMSSASDALIDQFLANFLARAEATKATLADRGAESLSDGPAALAATPPQASSAAPTLDVFSLLWSLLKRYARAFFTRSG